MFIEGVMMADIDEWISKYLGYVDQLAGMIPYQRVKLWRDFVMSPAAVIRKDDVGIVQRMKDIYAMTAVSYLIAGIMVLPALALLLLGFGGMALLGGGAGLMIIGAVVLVMVIAFVITPFINLLYSLLELLVAKLLGGTGSMASNFNASVLPSLAMFLVELPITILMIPLVWLGMVPFVSICAACIRFPLSLIVIVMGLYGIYLKYVAMKEVHKLSSMRAAGVVLIPVLLICAVCVVLVVVFYAALLAWAMSINTAAASANMLLPS
jgi:hypothetical protein